MLKFIIILLYLSKEVFDTVIDYLDARHITTELPENVRNVYSEEEYRGSTAPSASPASTTTSPMF